MRKASSARDEQLRSRGYGNSESIERQGAHELRGVLENGKVEAPDGRHEDHEEVGMPARATTGVALIRGFDSRCGNSHAES